MIVGSYFHESEGNRKMNIRPRGRDSVEISIRDGNDREFSMVVEKITDNEYGVPSCGTNSAGFCSRVIFETASDSVIVPGMGRFIRPGPVAKPVVRPTLPVAQAPSGFGGLGTKNRITGAGI